MHRPASESERYVAPKPSAAATNESPHSLEYEPSVNDQRYLRLMNADRTSIVSAVILASVILSGLMSCTLAGMFWILVLKLLGRQ